MVEQDHGSGRALSGPFLYRQLDGLQALRQSVRRDLLAESRKHSATKWLRQVPGIGPIRAAVLIALLQTPERFRTKRQQLWAYSGLAIETHGSGEYRYLDGQLRRSQKSVALRGLNRNDNHDLKWIVKSARYAIRDNRILRPADTTFSFSF
jgi:transposase